MVGNEADAHSGSMLRVIDVANGGSASARSVPHPPLAPSGPKIAAAARKRIVATTGDESESHEDWVDIEQMAREVIFPRGDLVMFRRPQRKQAGVLLVSSQTGARLLAAISGGFVCADAKVDTNANKFPLSAIAARTDQGTVYTCAWWLAQKENCEVTTDVGRALLGFVPCCLPGCACTPITTFGDKGSIIVQRACAKTSDGSFRVTWSFGVDKHWPSMNAYSGLGFPLLLCDFHGIKAFDKQLYERTGLTKEACCQLGIVLRLLKRGRGPDFAQGVWLPALVELLMGWVRDGLFGVDMELVRAVLAYAQAMWLKPIILTAWTDTSALVQPG